MNTAKKTWVSPKATLEEFTPNEYVSACVVGYIQCKLPGSSSDGYDDGTDIYYERNAQGKIIAWHGLCGNNASITFNGKTGSGYEVLNNQVQRNRPITNIKGYELKKGTYYNVTWDSTDGAGTYHHIGRLNVDYIDNDHPNHS